MKTPVIWDTIKLIMTSLWYKNNVDIFSTGPLGKYLSEIWIWIQICLVKKTYLEMCLQRDVFFIQNLIRWHVEQFLFKELICFITTDFTVKFLHGILDLRDQAEWNSSENVPECQVINAADFHYNDIMGAMASQITSLTIVYSIAYSDADQRKHKAPRDWPLRGEFIVDRWIPRTNGQ